MYAKHRESIASNECVELVVVQADRGHWLLHEYRAFLISQRAAACSAHCTLAEMLHLASAFGGERAAY